MVYGIVLGGRTDRNEEIVDFCGAIDVMKKNATERINIASNDQ